MVLAFQSRMTPPAQPASTPSPAPQPDITSLLDAAKSGPLPPRYAPGYTPPDKPKQEDIVKLADASKQANQPYLDAVADTYKRIRQQTSGYLTEADKTAREQGKQIPFRNTGLVDALNRFQAYLAARPIAFSVDVTDPEVQQYAQNIEDFAYFLRRAHERTWVRSGNMSLSMAEAKDLTIYGSLVSRRTCNPENPKLPIRARLIDPATVFPIYGPVGTEEDLQAVLHVYTTSARRAVAEWCQGDPDKKVRDALGDKLDGVGSDADVDVIEYYDSWWCGAFISGTDVALKPIMAHEYGCVPYVIQYGPGGEPMHTRNPGASFNPYSTVWGSGNSEDERAYKATGFIEPMKPLQDFIEGVGARALDGFVKAYNPPWMWERTRNAIKTLDEPMVDMSEGAQNTAVAGEEKPSPILPQQPTGETNLIMSMLQENVRSNRIAVESRTMPSQSNITGQAMAHSAEDGREIEGSWVEALELYHGRCASLDINVLYRNVGHESRYLSGSKKSYYVPRRNPIEGEAPSFELTPEMIDAVDTDVTAMMNQFRLSELMPFAQIAQMFGPQGMKIWSNRDIAQKIGKTDYDRTKEQIDIDELVAAARDLPEFKKLLIPAALRRAAEQATGNDDLQQQLLTMLEDWEKLIAQPQRMQMEAAGQPQPQAPQGPPGMPNPGAGIAGGAGAPYAGMNMGPGSQGAPVGAPPAGPAGPGPVPPPPGSARIV